MFIVSIILYFIILCLFLFRNLRNILRSIAAFVSYTYLRTIISDNPVLALPVIIYIYIHIDGLYMVLQYALGRRVFQLTMIVT